MRILLTNHSPLDGFGPGVITADLARVLTALGHDVRILIVDQSQPQRSDATVNRVICSANNPQADLNFALPWFTPRPLTGQTFADLTSEQLNQYRQAFRQLLDDAVDRFDPHMIHGQHLWIQGELALETGVPYVLTAHGDELPLSGVDPRIAPLVSQAAENAGRIIVQSDRLAQLVLHDFPDVAERIVVLPTLVAARLAQLYRDVLVQRFGSAPE